MNGLDDAIVNNRIKINQEYIEVHRYESGIKERLAVIALLLKYLNPAQNLKLNPNDLEG